MKLPVCRESFIHWTKAYVSKLCDTTCLCQNLQDAAWALSDCIDKRRKMFSRGRVRIRGASTKKEQPQNTTTSLPHSPTFISPAVNRKRSLSQISSTIDPAPPRKMSVIDQALNLIHPHATKVPNAKLKIAPSGAIVFTPAQSQESLGSSILHSKDLSPCKSVSGS